MLGVCTYFKRIKITMTKRTAMSIKWKSIVLSLEGDTSRNNLNNPVLKYSYLSDVRFGI